MGRASLNDGGQVDCAGGHLAAGDVDGSYRGHGAGHGNQILMGGYEDDKSTDGGNRG